jgi:hypothetical protein
MKQLTESGAAWICAIVQDICAHIGFDVVSLPGGSVIAILLSLHAIAMGSVRRAATQRGSLSNPVVGLRLWLVRAAHVSAL